MVKLGVPLHIRQFERREKVLRGVVKHEGMREVAEELNLDLGYVEKVTRDADAVRF